MTSLLCFSYVILPRFFGPPVVGWPPALPRKAFCLSWIPDLPCGFAGAPFGAVSALGTVTLLLLIHYSCAILGVDL
nr:MAG TPA: hypothetical protein [Caudoviricetes sp.]